MPPERVALPSMTRTEQPAWRVNGCAPLADRINWCGAYDFSQGQCFIWHEGGCDQEHTTQFWPHLAAWLGDRSTPIVLIWDGVPWHKASSVQDAAAGSDFSLKPLPGYSLDRNPIEGLWKWMREEVTQLHCHATMRDLFDACKAFIHRINAEPEQVISRL